MVVCCEEPNSACLRDGSFMIEQTYLDLLYINNVFLAKSYGVFFRSFQIITSSIKPLLQTC